MPVIQFTESRLRKLKCPENKKKINYFDRDTRGLMVEVRENGKQTFYLRYNTPRQRQKNLKISRDTDLSLKQIRLRAAQIRAAVTLGEDPVERIKNQRKIPTLEQFVVEHYIPYIKTYKRSWSTDVSILKNHIYPYFSNKYLDEITKLDLQVFHLKKKESGLSPATANRLLILIRYIFNLAIKWEICGLNQNPTTGIELFQTNNKIERFLTKSDIEHLYTAVKQSQNKMLRYIVPFLILTGARRNEALKAKWNEFDLEQRLWRIPITKSGKARHVPLSDSTIALLAQIKDLNVSSTYVLPNPKTGKPFSSIFGAWDTARKRCGLDDVRIHDLRHTFASLLVNNGRTLYEVQKLLGHSQIETTQRYAHLSQETLQDATNTATKGFDQLFT